MRSSTPIVLIADDDKGILAIVSRLLELNGFLPLTASDGSEALRLFRETQPALVILDVVMPVQDGISVCREIRAVSRVPVIMLTGLEDESDVTAALEEGADDYVRKPFGAKELMARIRAVLRRSGNEPALPKQLRAGSLIVDEERHLTLIGDEEVPLTRTEFAVLALLARNPNRVLTHDLILERVWGAEYAGHHHVLQVTVSRIRHKLDRFEVPEIENVSGVGYRLKVI